MMLIEFYSRRLSSLFRRTQPNDEMLPYIIITSVASASSSLSLRGEFLITFVTLIGNENCSGVKYNKCNWIEL